MSRQFQPPAPEEPPFDEGALKDIRRNLSMLSVPSLRNEYRRLHKQCETIGDKLPSPRVVQEFVQVYQQLCKWRALR